MKPFSKLSRQYIAAVLLLLWQGCSIHAPEMKFTGEKTALENQILGTYSQVQEDVWMVASVRAANPDSQITLSEEKREVLTAIQNREFNKDDIDEFKRDGTVGENARGFLEILPSERMENDPDYRRLVDEIVREENRDRKIIMKRIIAVNPTIQASDEAEVERVFAKLNYENAREGEWIQAENGEWIRKSKK